MHQAVTRPYGMFVLIAADGFLAAIWIHMPACYFVGFAQHIFSTNPFYVVFLFSQTTTPSQACFPRRHHKLMGCSTCARRFGDVLRHHVLPVPGGEVRARGPHRLRAPFGRDGMDVNGIGRIYLAIFPPLVSLAQRSS